LNGGDLSESDAVVCQEADVEGDEEFVWSRGGFVSQYILEVDELSRALVALCNAEH
jgi:hypothetical protein